MSRYLVCMLQHKLPSRAVQPAHVAACKPGTSCQGADARHAPCGARSDKATSALTQLAGEGRSKAAFLGAVREAVGGLMQLAGRDAPPCVYLTLQHVRRTL